MPKWRPRQRNWGRLALRSAFFQNDSMNLKHWMYFFESAFEDLSFYSSKRQYDFEEKNGCNKLRIWLIYSWFWLFVRPKYCLENIENSISKHLNFKICDSSIMQSISFVCLFNGRPSFYVELPNLVFLALFRDLNLPRWYMTCNSIKSSHIIHIGDVIDKTTINNNNNAWLIKISMTMLNIPFPTYFYQYFSCSWSRKLIFSRNNTECFSVIIDVTSFSF